MRASLNKVGLIIISMTLTVLLFSQILSPSKATTDFIYLANVIEKQTQKSDSTIIKLLALTDWLHENVVHIPNDGSIDPSQIPNGDHQTVEILKSGLGNCRVQANNIIVLSQMLGIQEWRRMQWQGKDPKTGSQILHVVAEVKHNDRWMMLDPDHAGYQMIKGQPISIGEMLQSPDRVSNPTLKNYILSTRENPRLLFASPIVLNAPLPLGEESLALYLQLGPVLTKALIGAKNAPLAHLLVFLAFFGLLEMLIQFLERTRTTQ